MTDEIQVYLVVFVAMCATSVLRFCFQTHRLLPPYLLSYFIFILFFWGWGFCLNLLPKHVYIFYNGYYYYSYNFFCVCCLAFGFANIFEHYNLLFETIKPINCSCGLISVCCLRCLLLWYANKWKCFIYVRNHMYWERAKDRERRKQNKTQSLSSSRCISVHFINGRH